MHSFSSEQSELKFNTIGIMRLYITFAKQVTLYAKERNNR